MTTELILPIETPTDINNILLQITLEKKHKLKLEKLAKLAKLEKINTINTKAYNSIDIICYDCKSRNLNEHNGYYICQECGLYNDCIIDSGQEWRFYGADDNKGNDQSRCDIPTNELLPKTSIGALVGFSTRENKTSKRIRNMNNWNAIPYRESSLLETFNNITIMSQNSGINQCIIEEAKYMYKKVTDIKSSRRTKKEAMKAGCIMLACKLKGVPRNCSEIAKIFKLKNNKTFRKSVKTFEEIWNNIKLTENGITDKIKIEINLENNILKKNKQSSYSDSSSDSDSDSSYSKSDSSSDSDSSDSDSDSSESESDISDSDTSDSEESNIIKKIDTIKKDNSIRVIDSIIDIDKFDNPIKPNCPVDIDINLVSTIDNKSNYKDLETNLVLETNIVRDTKLVLDTKDTKTIDKNSKTLQDCITKLHRYSCILGFDDKIFDACRIILTHIENEKYLEKHTPQSRTSAVIYYIIDRLSININKNHILQTCEVSDVTINKCFQKLMKFKKELLQIKIEI
jgi:transcription initiation factor TFIIIB Brf1 subunit/transcription initiation factor TFIIB